jgi:NADH:ubiquinone oxidoreductase subunit K
MTLAPFDVSLAAALVMISIGLVSLMISRNLIKLIVALQIASKGAIIALILAGVASGQLAQAQSMAATFIMVDTIVAVVGLALAIQLQRRCGTLDLGKLAALRDPPPDLEEAS